MSKKEKNQVWTFGGDPANGANTVTITDGKFETHTFTMYTCLRCEKFCSGKLDYKKELPDGGRYYCEDCTPIIERIENFGKGNLFKKTII